nr:hypothetical protein [bacterium]
MGLPANDYKRLLESLLRWWILAAVFFLVLGQVSLNRDNPEEALLAQPAFRFRAACVSSLDFSVGGKIANLVYPAAGLWLACAAWGAFKKRPPLLFPVLGFLLAAAVSCAFSPLTRLSWETGVKPLLTATMLFLIVATAFGPEIWRRRLLVAVFGALLLTAAAGLALYLGRVYFPQTDQRIWLSFGHPNSSGAVMIPAIAIVAAYLMTSAPARVKVACALTLPILAATMVLTFSRTAWISLLLALGVLAFWAGT